MKYILASDYDGTISKQGVITEKTKNAIAEFSKKGNMFGVVTGRDYVNGYETFNKNADFSFDFMIMSNGASACDSDGNIYFSKSIDGGIPWGNTTFIEALVTKCMKMTDRMCFVSFEKSRSVFHPDYPLGGADSDFEYAAHSELKQIREFVSCAARCYKTEDSAEVAKALNEEFGEYITPTQNGICIDIVPVGVDKATGIEELAKCLGFDKDAIWTAGDNFNDIAMLEKYHGCAMSDGVPEIASVAEYVCDDIGDIVKIILEM